jgi:FeS assembly SUF system protein
MIEHEVSEQIREMEVREEEVVEQAVSGQEQVDRGLESPAGVDTSPDLEASIIEVLHTCFDPEIPVDIYELGLIYGIDVVPPGEVKIRMTLTSPGCPVAGSLPGEVEDKVRSIAGVTEAKVELVWDPPWGMEKMSEAAKLHLGMF